MRLQLTAILGRALNPIHQECQNMVGMEGGNLPVKLASILLQSLLRPLLEC